MPTPGVTFPADWPFRVIASDSPELPERIRGVALMFGLPAPVTRANSSSGGRYVTYEVTIRVPDRLALAQATHALSCLPGVHMVL